MNALLACPHKGPQNGPDGGPPNNWLSAFGGGAWEWDEPTGQYYLHSFLRSQPDLDWRNPEVEAAMHDVMRFWLDRGVDGFRIDVSDALIKDVDLPDTPTGEPVIPKDDASGVHDIYRAFRRLFDSYDHDPMAVIETGAPDDVVAALDGCAQTVDATYETLLVETRDDVLTITLNRPDRLNAFDHTMTDELSDVLKKAERDAIGITVGAEASPLASSLLSSSRVGVDGC